MALRPSGAWGQLQCYVAEKARAVEEELEELDGVANQLKIIRNNIRYDLKIQVCELESLLTTICAVLLVSAAAAPFTFGLSLLAGAIVSAVMSSELQEKHRRQKREAMNEINEKLSKFKRGIKHIQSLVKEVKRKFTKFHIDSSALVQMDSRIEDLVDEINEFSDPERLERLVKQCYEVIRYMEKKVPEVEAQIYDFMDTLRNRPGVHSSRQLQ